MAELDQDENGNLETRGFSEFKKKKKVIEDVCQWSHKAQLHTENSF